MAKSNSFLSPYEILPIAQENKHLDKFYLSTYHKPLCCVYLLETPHRGDFNEYTQHTIIVKKIEKTSLNYCLAKAVLTSTHNLCFEQKYEKYQSPFLSENFNFFFVVKCSVYLNRHVFVKNARLYKPNTVVWIYVKIPRKCHSHEARPSRDTQEEELRNK